MVKVWLAFLVAYLLGSIPTAYIVGRLAAGVDIRQVGDGNVDAKNVHLHVGPLPGIVVGIVDIAKGALAVLCAKELGLPEIAIMIAGFIVVLAHDWMLPLRFRGGQGMAASVGAVLILLPRETLIALATVGLFLVITRNWDLSRGIGFGLLPLLAWLAGQPPRRVLYPVLLFPTIGLKKLIDLPRARGLASKYSVEGSNKGGCFSQERGG